MNRWVWIAVGAVVVLVLAGVTLRSILRDSIEPEFEFTQAEANAFWREYIAEQTAPSDPGVVEPGAAPEELCWYMERIADGDDLILDDTLRPSSVVAQEYEAAFS